MAIDSGCTKHMSNHIENHLSLKKGSGAVRVENDDVINSIEYETAMVTAMVEGVRENIALQNEMFTPDFIYNLESLSQAIKKYYKIMIDERKNRSCDVVLKNIQMISDEVKMVDVETSYGLY